MPELPETETIARDLDRSVAGAVISEARVHQADVLREVSPDAFVRRVTGATIVTCWRRAKLVVLDLSTADRIVVQPRFTGALLVDDGVLADTDRSYTTLSFLLSDGRTLRYRDVRRLGTVTVMDTERWQDYSSALGPEPLDDTFTAAQLSASLRGSGQAIKKVLMDQRRLAGVGNIYANEALWRARVDPSRPARTLDAAAVSALHAALVSVLRESIEARGTTFRDYRDPSGRRGSFAERLAVYGRGGLPCPRCGARLIDTNVVDGRTTVFCARCQGRAT